MFKSITAFRIGSEWQAKPEELESKLDGFRFIPCGATATKSCGWSEPRGIDHGPLFESVGGQWILRVSIEKKDLPASVVALAVEEEVAKIEENQGRKVGKKERREIKDSVTHALLPQAFAKRSAVHVWIDPVARMLYIDSTSTTVTDEVVTMLVRAVDGLVILPINTTMSPEGAMAAWLSAKEIDANFDFGGECELLANDESKAAVKYANHRLDIDEIEGHIRVGGKVPKSLSLVWNDRVSAVLNRSLQIKKIKMLEEGGSQESANQGNDDPFNANVAIFTAEFSGFMTDLIAALGGETKDVFM